MQAHEEISRDQLVRWLRYAHGHITEAARAAQLDRVAFLRQVHRFGLSYFARALREEMAAERQVERSGRKRGRPRLRVDWSIDEVRALLGKSHGNVSAAARELGAPLQRLYSWIATNGLDEEARAMRAAARGTPGVHRAAKYPINAESLRTLLVECDGDLTAVGQRIGGTYYTVYWLATREGLHEFARELRARKSPWVRLRQRAVTDESGARDELLERLSARGGDLGAVAEDFCTSADRVAEFVKRWGLDTDAARLSAERLAEEHVRRQSERDRQREEIQKALDATNGNIAAAARALGKSTQKVWDAVKQLGIVVPPSPERMAAHQRAARNRDALLRALADSDGSPDVAGTRLGLGREALYRRMKRAGLSPAAFFRRTADPGEAPPRAHARSILAVLDAAHGDLEQAAASLDLPTDLVSALCILMHIAPTQHRTAA